MREPRLLAATLFFCAACGSSTSAPIVTDTLNTTGCDPLVPQQCGFPFPSSVYLVSDPKTPTGYHVQFGPQTLPAQAQVATDPTPWTGSDGFSPGGAAMAYLPGATATGLPNEDNLALSVTVQSPTILLNTTTGKLVPHLAELDVSTTIATDQALLIHPVIRLDDNTRYIVAIRHVVDISGKQVPPSPAFAALRDGDSFPDASIDRRRALYADIFAQLKKAGIDPSDLQLAWDYRTASRDNNTRTLVAMRDLALAAVGEDGPTYTITQVIDNPNPDIRRRILGTMHVPLFLDQATVTGKMVVDENGLPKQNGFADYPFLVQIPNIALLGVPGAILQNGHGLFGSMTEGQDSYMATITNQKDYVEIAVDLVGFASADWPTVLAAITRDMGAFKQVADRQQQGMVNQLMAMRMMKGRFYKDPMVQFNGQSTIDPTHCYYRGDSQGGIMGTTYMAISTDVTRGLLGEPGMPYNLLLNRSVDFGPYFGAIKATTGSFMDVQLALGAVEMLWDRVEPDGYAPYITENMLPNTPAHNVLLNLAIGDQQVTTLGGHVLARTIKAQNMMPTNREIFGITDAAPPFTGNGMAEWDFGLPKVPTQDIPPPTTQADPHDIVRTLQSAIDMTDTWLRDGIVQNECGGKCQDILTPAQGQ